MSKRGQRGFTLIELLVGLTLLGLVVVALSGGLRIGLMGTDRVTTRASQLDQLRGVQAFLRERIAAARPIRWTDDRGGSVIAFDGRAGRLAFVADLPAYPDVGGLYKLVVEREGTDLVLARTLTEGRVPGFDGVSATRDVIARDIGVVRFSYFGRADRGEPMWHDTWTAAQSLPDLVRIELGAARTDGAIWPAIVIAPRLGEQPR
ncbi:MAG: prepilin-type N-terminal cleavage/methylation domain-containing protein [Alphaproteobacteria bacterium]